MSTPHCRSSRDGKTSDTNREAAAAAPASSLAPSNLSRYPRLHPSHSRSPSESITYTTVSISPSTSSESLAESFEPGGSALFRSVANFKTKKWSSHDTTYVAGAVPANAVMISGNGGAAAVSASRVGESPGETPGGVRKPTKDSPWSTRTFALFDFFSSPDSLEPESSALSSSSSLSSLILPSALGTGNGT